jgi:YVTN family beta-propeller protein
MPAADDRHVAHPERTVVTRIAVIPDRTAGPGVGGQARDWSTRPVRTEIPAAVALLEAQPPSEPRAVTTTSASVRFVTNFLTAALAPFIVPLPGSPVDQPTQWAVLAWLRKQSARNVLDRRPNLVVDPQRTEQVDTRSDAADTPRATVESIDAVTGRVRGGVGATDHRRLHYELAEPIDRRLGSVTVDRHTGQWTFAPRQPTRLAAALGPDNGVVEFSIVGSDGRTVDVRAPVDPAEAAVTGAIDLGHGLIYGLAAVADRLYVLNGASDTGGNGSVTVVDTSTRTVAGSIEVGGMPSGIAVGGRRLYVGNTDDGTVSVVDVASNEVVDVIDVGANPFGLEVSGDRLYVADHAGTVSVIDLGDNAELARIPVAGNPFAVAATADRLYVTDYAGATVAVVDRATNTAVDPGADVGAYPFYAAVVGRRLYVVNTATNALTIIDETGDTVMGLDVAAGSPDPVPAGAAPVELLVRGDRLYVSNVNCGAVAVIDVASGEPVDTIAVGIHPGLLTATADGRTVYVADVLSGTVRVITSVRHIAEL